MALNLYVPTPRESLCPVCIQALEPHSLHFISQVAICGYCSRTEPASVLHSAATAVITRVTDDDKLVWFGLTFWQPHHRPSSPPRSSAPEDAP